MKYKNRRLSCVALSVILIVSIIGQSFTVMGKGMNPGTGDTGGGSGIPHKTSGYLVSAVGWLFSIQKIDNTAGNYRSTNKAEIDQYGECSISIVDEYLYDYPECYVGDVYDHTCNYAYVQLKQSDNYATVNGYKYTKDYYMGSEYGDPPDRFRIEDPQYKIANAYSAQKATGDFKASALLLDGKPAIKNKLMTYSLTLTDIRSAYSQTQLDAAVQAFVALWKNSDTADDIISDFISISAEADYYDQLIRYQLC